MAYPASIGLPGVSGGSWVKWLDNIEFKEAAGWNSKWEIARAFGAVLAGGDFTNIDAFNGTEAWVPMLATAVNTAWLNPVNDGTTVKMQNGKVPLNGWSFSWTHGGHRVEQIAFSADYGNTWTYVDVPEELEPVPVGELDR